MSLGPGVHVRPYDILSAIGVGGMGEVYRVRGTHLDRDVAIKVLPDAFAADPERLARFERECSGATDSEHSGLRSVIASRMRSACESSTRDKALPGLRN
jgi:serine/threonine protein kinase